MKYIVSFCFFFSQSLWGGRPVIYQLSLDRLAESSEFIVTGEILKTFKDSKCPEALFHFKVNLVTKGSQNISGQIISVYSANHLLLSNVDWKNSKGPSYEALVFKNDIDLNLKKSTVYLKKSVKDCYELTAQGAQTN